VKICGLTRAADASAAVDAGADAVGVVFYEPSPRSARLDDAPAIRDAVPAFVSLVLVTVDLEPATLRQWIGALEPDILQFHGDEPPALCEQFGLPYIKSVRMRDGVDIANVERRYSGARALLLDTFLPGVVGGTGRSFDWGLARECRAKPAILAGGLDATNVAEAMRQARPFAVDVSSGVESSPGIKDHEAIGQLMNAVRAADEARPLSAVETR
jgi:phosphoribosylanthranilate isomerase